MTIALTNPVRPAPPARPVFGGDWTRRLPPSAPYLLAGLLLLAIAGAALGNFGSRAGAGAGVEVPASPTPTAKPTRSVAPTPSPTVVLAPVRAEPDAKPPKPEKDRKDKKDDKKKGG